MDDVAAGRCCYVDRVCSRDCEIDFDAGTASYFGSEIAGVYETEIVIDFAAGIGISVPGRVNARRVVLGYLRCRVGDQIPGVREIGMSFPSSPRSRSGSLTREVDAMSLRFA